jgi:hypothetical protein
MTGHHHPIVVLQFDSDFLPPGNRGEISTPGSAHPAPYARNSQLGALQEQQLNCEHWQV